MEIYLDGNKIYEKDCIKLNSKMWVFRDVADIEPLETTYVDYTLLSNNPNNNMLEIYYIDGQMNYWKKDKCFFSKKEMEEEKYRRGCIKHGVEYV